MKRRSAPDELEREWEAYLAAREHEVRQPDGIIRVLQSRNGRGVRYRWLLLSASGKTRTLSRAEVEDIEHHLKQSRRLNQRTYLVVLFEKAQPKVVVLPAERALKGKRILRNKAGIPWGD